jgi:3-oxoacyl-[acyl-carrier protein] reductase
LQRLDDLVVIVTGAGQGIGRAAAMHLATLGATVVAADINKANIDGVVDSLGQQGLSALAVQIDVSSEGSVFDLIGATVREYGRIDVLFNNAAVFSSLKMQPIEDISVEDWDHVMAVNLKGAFLCSRAVVPHMKARSQGKIINVSSSTVFLGRPNYLHYVTSKAGVVGFTRALARELAGSGITVNAIAPGSVKTEIERETVSPAQVEAIIRERCVQRVQTPEDLVGALTFLVSSASDFMSGQTIVVDGGQVMH